MKLGFDVDGVVSDTVNDMLTFLNSKNKTKYNINDVTQYNLSTVGVTDVGQFLKDYEHRYPNILVMPHAKETIRSLIADGHNISFISARSYDGALNQLCDWLFANDLPADVIIVGQGHKKGKMCNYFGIDVFIDDNVDELENIIKVAPNTKPLLYSSPWNLNHQSKIETVDGWAGIYNYIKRMM